MLVIAVNVFVPGVSTGTSTKIIIGTGCPGLHNERGLDDEAFLKVRFRWDHTRVTKDSVSDVRIVTIVTSEGQEGHRECQNH